MGRYEKVVVMKFENEKWKLERLFGIFLICCRIFEIDEDI